MRKITWNKKVAASRGDNWRKALVQGKLAAKMNPTQVQQARVKKQIPQIEAAKALGMSLATYGAIERAKRPVTPETAAKVSQFFGKAAKDFFKKNPGKSNFIAK